MRTIDQEALEKRQAELKQQILIHPESEALSMDIKEIERQLSINQFEVSSKAASKVIIEENIQGFVALVNVFLRAMCLSSKNPSLVNIEDIDLSNDELTNRGSHNLLYQSTIQFNDYFTT